MNKVMLLGCLGSLFIFLLACNANPNPANEELTEEVADTVATDSMGFNAELAKELGADPYGMKQYVMAFLKRGPNRDLDSAKAMKLQMEHLDNITRMAKEGKLLLAGPFMDDGEVRGIYIFDVRTLEEAKALTETDPAIQAGSLEMELRPWYGSAALMKVNEIHKQVKEKGITDN